ncbi:glycoside hydrolase [Marinactinospora rubrisoli]|uniref:Glycoside hydrolase n=1 Tax=Marinactinospora rubrisoli TaxID=2715399 RepID=A0ABW2K891_9ACTN
MPRPSHHTRPARTTPGRAATPAAFLAGVLAVALAPAAPAQAAADPVEIRLDPSYQHPAFEGWGTSLIWFGNVTGGWPDPVRERLADDLFGPDGLRFTIARYNIGGGDSPETEPYMRPGGAVPGWWNRPPEFGPPPDADPGWTEPRDWWDPDDPGHWNLAADADQRWWITAAADRGADTFEAFSNSAPYFMTESGFTSGNVDGNEDNLRDDQYERFAAYLAGVVEHVEESAGIEVASLSPMNEPNTPYWSAGGRQEGSHWSPAAQQRMIAATRAELDRRGMDTAVAAMDETNPGVFRTNWESYDAATRAAIDRLNVHTYSPTQRTGPRDIAKGADTPLWMSEVDLGPSGIPQDFTDIRPGLALSQRITGDIRELEPSAWVLWQAIEDYENMSPEHENMNWGLIQVDFTTDDPAAEPVRRNKKFYVMGNYSRFVEPGSHVIATDDADTLAAIDPTGRRVVVVHTNSTGAPRELDLDLSGFAAIDASARAVPHTTSAEHDLRRGAAVPVRNERLRTSVPAGSVTTFVIDGVRGVDPAEAPLGGAAERELRNANSGMALTATTAGTVVQRAPDSADPAQRWTLDKRTDGWTNREEYRITNTATGQALGLADGELVLADPGDDPGQRWMFSGSGDGGHTLVNAATGELLDVLGQSTEDGAPVGVWPPTTGANQTWTVRDLPSGQRTEG